MILRCTALLILATTSPALAGAPAPMAALAELSAHADAVCAATVTGTKPDVGREPGVAWHLARIDLVTEFSGECPDRAELAYIGIGTETSPTGRHRFAPREGRTYLMFIDRSDPRRLALTETQLPSGLLELRGDLPEHSDDLFGVVWRSLVDDLRSDDAGRVRDAARTLHSLSVPIWTGAWPSPVPRSFERDRAVEVLLPLLGSELSGVSEVVLDSLSWDSPVASDDQATSWLHSLGGGGFPHQVERDPDVTNVIATVHFDEAASFIDGEHPTELRSRAVRLLGGERLPLRRIEGWLADAEPSIRASAALLLSDVPARQRGEPLAAALTDPDATVRGAAARAVGFAQDVHHFSRLEELLDDPEPSVQWEAARTLLSFHPEVARPILARHLDHPAYGGTFVVALATDDPAPHAQRLATLIDERYRPEPWWGGVRPDDRSWDLLFRHVEGLPGEALSEPAAEALLDALELADFNGSASPGTLHGLYVARGLTERADALRERVSAENPKYRDAAEYWLR